MTQRGFTFIEILVVIAVLIILTAGGVVVWEKKVSLTPSPIPTLAPTQIPTVNLTLTPTPKISPTSISGLPEPAGEIEVRLSQEFTLKKGQLAKVLNTQLTIKVLEIVYQLCPTGVQCIWAGPTYTNLEVKYETFSDTISLGQVTATNDKKKQDVFGFTISLFDISADEIQLKVEQACWKTYQNKTSNYKLDYPSYLSLNELSNRVFFSNSSLSYFSVREQAGSVPHPSGGTKEPYVLAGRDTEKVTYAGNTWQKVRIGPFQQAGKTLVIEYLTDTNDSNYETFKNDIERILSTFEFR